VLPRDEHRDYQASANLIVRRTVLFVKDPGYLLVLDSVRDEESDRFNRASSLWWHSPQTFRPLGPGLARTDGRQACLLAWAYPESIRRVEIGDDFHPEDLQEPHRPAHESWHSLRLRAWMETSYDGCLGFASLLFPFTSVPPTVSIRPLPLAGGVRYRAEAFEVATPAGRDLFVLNPERLPGVAFGKRAITRAMVELGNRRGQFNIE
jgi:hypothetical protein